MNPAPSNETFGEALERIRREVETAPGIYGWLLRRRHRKIRAKAIARRDEELARYWRS